MHHAEWLEVPVPSSYVSPSQTPAQSARKSGILRNSNFVDENKKQ